jgi:hypothetical protein
MGNVTDLITKRHIDGSNESKEETTQNDFLSSAFYTHNDPRNLEDTILLAGGALLMVVLPTVLWIYGGVPIVMSTVSGLLGVTLGVTKYCFFPYQALSIYRAERQPVVAKQAEIVPFRKAA